LGGTALLVASPECRVDGLSVACGGEEMVPVPHEVDALER
jgi:hypothetical protein